MLTCVPAPYPRLHRSSVLSAQALVMVASGRPDSAWPFQTPVGRGPALAMERALSRWEAGAVLTHGSGCRTPALSRRWLLSRQDWRQGSRRLSPVPAGLPAHTAGDNYEPSLVIYLKSPF